jgi:hypothetical protein
MLKTIGLSSLSMSYTLLKVSIVLALLLQFC